jgi:hypothetical protein
MDVDDENRFDDCHVLPKMYYNRLTPELRIFRFFPPIP